MLPELLRTEVRETPTGPVLWLAGELDWASRTQLRTAAGEAAAAPGFAGPLVVDVTALRFIDAAGVSLLLQAARATTGQLPVLRGASDSVRRIFRILGLEDLFA